MTRTRYPTTVAYRAQNQRLRADLTRALGKQFVFLNPRDLDGSWWGYRAVSEELIRSTAQVANYTALDYFRVWLHDEVGEVMAERYLDSPVPIDLNDVGGLLRLKGPIEIKRLIEKGWKPEDAWLSAMSQTANVARGYVHAIGQRTLVNTLAEYPHVLQGWRRIISPTACSFCRKLERTVWHPSNEWVKPHDGCGCTAEPVPNNARVVPRQTPADKARNEWLRQKIAARKDREKAAFQRAAAMSSSDEQHARDLLKAWIEKKDRPGPRIKPTTFFGTPAAPATVRKWTKELADLGVTTHRYAVGDLGVPASKSSSFAVMDAKVAARVADEAKKQFGYYPTLNKAVTNIEGYTKADWEAQWPTDWAALYEGGEVHLASYKYRPETFAQWKRANWAVSRNAGDVLNHEIGHGILATFGTNSQHWQHLSRVVTKHGLAVRGGKGILIIDKEAVASRMGSQYATSSAHEFYAECWAMYQRDEGAAPEFVLEIAGYMESLLEKQAKTTAWTRNMLHPNLGSDNRWQDFDLPGVMREPHELPAEIRWVYTDFVGEAETGRFA